MEIILRIFTKKNAVLYQEWRRVFYYFKKLQTVYTACFVFIMTWSHAVFNTLLTPGAFFQKCIFLTFWRFSAWRQTSTSLLKKAFPT